MGRHLCHFEILSEDLNKTEEFYGNVLDWQFDEATFPGYVVMRSGAEPSGGIMEKTISAPHSALNVYFEVSSLDDALQRFTAAGGLVVGDKTEIPGIGRWALFTDLGGVAVGLLETMQG